MEDGTVISEDQIENLLEKDTISHSFGRSLNELLVLKLRVENKNYETAIKWLRRLLFSSEISTTKLANRFASYKASIPQTLREGTSVLAGLEWDKYYDDNKSTGKVSGLFEFLKWGPEMERLLKRNPKELVQNIKRLQEFCEYLTIISNLTTDRKTSGPTRKFESVCGRQYHCFEEA